MSTHNRDVTKYLKDLGIQTRAILTQKGANKDGWKHDAWLYNIGGEQFTFMTGIGLRNVNGTPVPPTAAGVIYSVLLDANASNNTFEDFCDELGYDTDSRKTLKTYIACQENGTKLRKIFTKDQIETLEVLLESY